MSWFIEVLKKYAVFEGRARRKEYWMFTLFYIIFAIVATVIDTMLATMGIFPIVTTILTLGLFIPCLAVLVRRLHDIDKSGWWVLLAFVPIASLVILVFAVMDGTPGDNRFGSNPKA